MGTLSPQVSSTGISGPDYSDIFTQLQYGFWTIYGSDAVLTSDSQDGQMLALFAQAIYDSGQTLIAVYNQFSPATAQGAGLSSVVKINGLARQIATNSTVSLTIIGQANTIITGGQVGDSLGLGTIWDLPSPVTIPGSGSLSTTATAASAGSTAAAAGTLTQILTPTFGWQSVTNASAATVGAPVESDAALRQRQAASTSLPAVGPLASIYAALANVPGVSSALIVQNATDFVDANGNPPHSIAPVVAGSAAPSLIATAIALKKAPGIQTVGNTSYTVLDANGVPNIISYDQQSQTQIYGSIVIAGNGSYSPSSASLIINAIVAFINGLGGNQNVYLNKLWAPANLTGDAAVNSSGMTQNQLDVISATFNVTYLQIGLSPSSLSGADVVMPFYSEALTSAANWQFAT